MELSVGLFRYPGGKQRMAGLITEKLSPYMTDTYCEPFVGAGGATFSILTNYSRVITDVHLNDIDYGVYAVWKCICETPQSLIGQLLNIIPSVNLFYNIKNRLRNNPIQYSLLDVATWKITIHQISFSGLGERAGGPIGGKKQGGRYKVDCRWNPSKLAHKINVWHELLQGFNTKITNHHFIHVIANKDTTYYLDPPYYEMGDTLYGCGMYDHCLLKDKCNTIKNFVLSYDNHPHILKLYENFHIDFIDAKYTIGISKEDRKQSKELLITK